jgi:glycosyltransferase involved in cell wall biosynthesis
MRILLINHYAGSPELGMEFRPYYFAKEWQKQGNEVLIIGATYSHLRKKQPQQGYQNIDGINYFWIKTNRYHGNGIKRLWSMILFVFKLLFCHKKRVKTFSPDIVIASSTYTLDNYVCHRFAKICNAKYIYEIHDLWPLSPMELGGMGKYHPFIMLMQWAENYAYKHCDAVVSMLPNAKNHCIEHGLAESKFFYVPNGVVVEDWINVKPIPQHLQNAFNSLKTKHNFIVGYLGGHAISNALNILIETAKLLQKYIDIKFFIVGDGVEKKQLIKKADGLQNVFFEDTVSKLSVPNLLQEFDVGIFGAQKCKLYQYGVSFNKMFDYMMAKLPIIQYIETVPDIPKTVSCGITVEPDNPQALAEAILQLRNIPKQERLKLGENGYQFVLKEHSYSVLSERFLNIMKNLAEK